MSDSKQTPIDVGRKPAPIHPANETFPNRPSYPWPEKPQPWPGGGDADGNPVSGA